MRLLLISVSAWKEDNALGNTFSNFFGNWDKKQLFNVYCRSEFPVNDVCEKYYSITEKDIIKNLITPWRIGKEIQKVADMKSTRQIHNENMEKRMLNFFRRNRYSIFLLARELIWSFGNWKNNKLDKFLADSNSEIIFCFATEAHYLNKLLMYCKTKSSAKLVLFFADDTYSYKSYMPIRFLYQFLSRRHIKNIVSYADKLYGASPKLCEEYSQIFKKSIIPMYKGCLFENHEEKKNISHPIKIVYAGNLFYGRWEILKILADEIERINTDSVKIILEIFTTATITHEIDIALNRGHSSRIMGALPYEDVKKVLREADIVLHVESFEPKQIKSTRLSFSTKIIDCMQSGSCLMAIGPQNIASIDYLKNIEGPIVVTEISRIGETLSNLIKKPENILSKANSLQKYAMKQHDINIVHERIQRDFSDLLKDNTFQ
jgi:hypothetical protein